MRFPSCFSRESTEGEPTSRAILGQGWGKQKNAPDVAQISRRLSAALLQQNCRSGRGWTCRVSALSTLWSFQSSHRDPSRGKENRNGRKGGGRGGFLWYSGSGLFRGPAA